MIPKRIFPRTFSHTLVMKHDFAQSRLFIYKIPVRVLHTNRVISKRMLINFKAPSALVIVFSSNEVLMDLTMQVGRGMTPEVYNSILLMLSVSAE